MNKGPSKPVKVENVFAQGFGALEEAEKQAKKDAKRAVKKAEREAAAEAARAEAAANPQPVEEEKPKAPKEKISWADCDSDDDLGMSPFNDKFEQEYKEKLADEADVSSDEEEHDVDEAMGSSPIVNTDFASSQQAQTETKQLSKKELKQKEMDDLDALLNEMGVENKGPAEEVKESAPVAEDEGEGKKKRSRGGKKKKGGEAEAPSAEEPAAVVAAPADIAKIMAAKGKKKGGGGKSAVELAAAEAKKRKNKDGGKKGKDQSNYNQMPTR